MQIYNENPDKLIFRGVRNSLHRLIPSVGRIKQKNGSKLEVNDEKLLLNVFKNRGYPFLKDYRNDDLEVLAIGQHHGLSTRLLDWSKNPLIATYFALEDSFDGINLASTEFSRIYIYPANRKVKLLDTFDPFDISCVERFVPKHWDTRIIAQGGDSSQ